MAVCVMTPCHLVGGQMEMLYHEMDDHSMCHQCCENFMSWLSPLVVGYVFTEAVTDILED
jgi:hypothetical protein